MKIEVKGYSKFAKKIRLLDQVVRKRVKIGLTQGGLMVQDKATENLKNIQWQTTNKKGYWRREKDGIGTVSRRVKNKKGKRTKQAGWKYYPPGATIMGHWVTGNLARSLHVRTEDVSLDEIDVIIGSDAPYAPAIESLPDGGFLAPALKSEGNKARKHAMEQVKRAIKGTAMTGE